MKVWDNKNSQELFLAILSLKTLNEAKRFFRDLLTKDEIIEFSKRYEAAYMLYNNITYSIIQKKTGLSSTTIARISKWLNGSMGGYRITLKRREHHGNDLLEKELP